MMSDARALTLECFRWIGGHAAVRQIFRAPEALASVVRGLAEPFRDDGVTAVCGIESRGFLLGAAVAVEFGVGFVAVRKSEGIFPGKKVTRRGDPDYRGVRQELRLQRAAVGPGDRVLLVDDWIETGSQASAVRSMVEECGVSGLAAPSWSTRWPRPGGRIWVSGASSPLQNFRLGMSSPDWADCPRAGGARPSGPGGDSVTKHY
ncbi:phosphoribosyltransferase family protein [Streptomyces sp. NPDC057253]|uniref:phosphoribosyltransferase family protein n=1 Tax=Streptomyces sp. NPDC057253 TaxID=3346069 RepID=UPI0036259E01